jgi:amino acid transporter
VSIEDAVKRVLVGRPVQSQALGETLLPKRIALPVFASDALSSVAYAPDEVFLTLAIAGLATYHLSPWVGLAVVAVLIVVVLSYRQNVHAYPSGGGDYEVVSTNLGIRAGRTVASALLVDYVLTVAVSISSAAQYAASAIPQLRGHEAVAATVAVLVLMAMNLRGVRESGTAFAVPTYIFMVSIIGMSLFGFVRHLTGNLPDAASSSLELVPEPGYAAITNLGIALLLMRAFSSGCAALTGVEAISNGVPAFREPKSKNAATTLGMLGIIAVTMVMSIITLANLMHVKFAEDPAIQLVRDGEPVGEEYVQDPIIGQMAKALFEGFSPAFYLVAAATGVILVLAANTAFNGFPVLGSILARDSLLPRQLHTRGDRLAFSNGIVALALAAIGLILVFDAQVTKLIQLYIVGVFISFTLSQLGMVRHWTRHLRTTVDKKARAHMKRSRVVNAVGLSMTGAVLVIVLISKFTRGAYLTLIAMACLYMLMLGIQKHYERVQRELRVAEDDRTARVLPSRVHALVLVAKIHKPTLRALAYARASRPSTIEAVTVVVDPKDTARLQAEWERREIPVPLRALDSPYREITRPVIEYVRSVRRNSPRDLVVVFVPEYVVGHWWEHLLHNQSALRLKSRLHFMNGVMVASVPWQLRSSAAVDPLAERPVSMLARVTSRRQPAALHDVLLHDVEVENVQSEPGEDATSAGAAAGPEPQREGSTLSKSPRESARENR